MSITRITTRTRHRKILAYDFEWVPGVLKIRLCGIYDGNTYRSYPDVRTFLTRELVAANRGAWFFAHAGGLADVSFVLEQAMLMNRWDVEASFSGSSAIIVHLREKHTRNVFHFVDSFWLLRTSLHKIGKWIGIEKLAASERETEEGARAYYANAPFSELRTYNQRDCVILWTAVTMMEDILHGMGSQLQMTIASCAMQLFRRVYLQSDIATCDVVNDIAKFSYVASRVEVFCSDCDEANYYDINSSFPFCMTQPCPGELTGAGDRIPDHGLYIADVEVTVPEIMIPPLPYRHKNRIYFPSGSWRNWFTSVDLEYLQECGGTINHTYEVLLFEERTDLRDYAIDVYEKRKGAPPESFESAVYKVMLNSLYGKFAEQRVKTGFLYDPVRFPSNMIGPPEMVFPGGFLIRTEAEVPHAHVPISAFITARSRANLGRFMQACDEVYYCDTDGFATSSTLPTSTELGDLKLEKVISHGRFVSPKIYRLDKASGEVIVKAKGFSLGRDEKAAIAKWERVASDCEVQIERMLRIRELYRTGSTRPTEEPYSKRLRRTLMDKRFMYPDGSSRPWTVEEIIEE